VPGQDDRRARRTARDRGNRCQLVEMSRVPESGVSALGLQRQHGEVAEDDARRLYGVLNNRLMDHAYLADDYSIADIATYPWIARHEWHKVDLNDFPHVKRWFDAISARPAVQKGMNVPPAPK